MCRLALLNDEGIRYIEKNLGGINRLFNHLEDSFGGQGNGYAVFKKDGSKIIKKGVNLKNETISQYILKNLHNISWVMYHTRIASISGISDNNCHPFIYGNKILMMNGTEIAYDLNNNMTDTENVLRLSAQSNVKLQQATKTLKSVFIGFDKGLYITKGRGDLLLLKENEAVVFASSFPENYSEKNTVYEAPKMWEEGDRLISKNLVKYVKKSYLKGNYSLDKYYDELFKQYDREYHDEMRKYYNDLEMCRVGETIDY